MPTSMNEHTDLLWLLVVIFGGGLLTTVGYSIRRELGHISDQNDVMMSRQAGHEKKLEEAMQRVHERIDDVKTCTDRLDGKVQIFERVIKLHLDNAK